MRNYLPSHAWAEHGGWNIADCVERAYDVEGMNVGVVAAGRIGTAVLERMKPFGVKLHYFDKHRLPEAVEKSLGATYHESVEDLVRVCDVVSIHCPLHPETEHLFNDELLGKMKRGSYIVNTARGKICDRDAIVRALQSGQLAGYAGDVWFPQPAPADHPWRTMPHEGMTPHVSGTTLSAQARYAAGTREISRVLLRRPTDPQRVSDRRRRQPRGRGSPFVHRGQHDRRQRTGGPPRNGRGLLNGGSGSQDGTRETSRLASIAPLRNLRHPAVVRRLLGPRHDEGVGDSRRRRGRRRRS
ncbi:MAG: NAD-dependent formate dehydrogenase [Pirellulales bacterium]